MMESRDVSTDLDLDEEDYFSYTGLPDMSSGFAPCKIEAISKFNEIFIPAAFVLVFVMDLLGNGLVLYVLRNRSCPWHLADHYLLQLAISDLLLGLTLPFWATQFGYGWIFGDVSCKLLGALFTINMYSSIFFLTCISLNRYLAIVHAVELHRQQRPIHTFFICAFVWGISCALSWPEFYFRDVVYFKQRGAYACYYNFHPEDADVWRVTLNIMNLSLGFLLPLLLMFFFYSQIFLTLHHSRLGYSRRSQVVIVMLLLVFVLCWAPYNLLLLIDSLQRLGTIGRSCELERLLDKGVTITESLGLAHVCLNPIIYAIVGVKFRKELSRLCKRRSNQSIHSGQYNSGEGTVLTETHHSYSYSRVL
ncbi:hypothetical protein FKM82_022186 [Ascaphus truei]